MENKKYLNFVIPCPKEPCESNILAEEVLLAVGDEAFERYMRLSLKIKLISRKHVYLNNIS